MYQLELLPGEADRRARQAILMKAERGPTEPSKMFHVGPWAGSFKTYDEKGFPLTDKEGMELSKKQKKKLLRLFSVQIKKYSKFAEKKMGNLSHTEVTKESKEDKTAKDNTQGGVDIVPMKAGEEGQVKLVYGSFGGRQALSLHSEMGPFSHVLDFF